MKDEFQTFLGYEWLQIEDGTVTVGVNDDGLDELTDITSINLPSEGEDVNPDEVCGEIETEGGSMNLYSPVEGKVIEVNGAVLENPQLILEDNFGDGWLFRVEATNAGDLDEIESGEKGDED